LELYGEYLRERGETERARVNLNLLKKTGNFNGVCSWENKNERKYFNKK
jgi:hypothetical protein